MVLYLIVSFVLRYIESPLCRDLESATAVMGYSGDAGFLCYRPDIIRNRIKATFCISMWFVLKCSTIHCLLCMWQLEAHNSSQVRMSLKTNSQPENKTLWGCAMAQRLANYLLQRWPEFINRPVYACSVVEKEETGRVSYEYFCLPHFASLHHCY